MDKHIILFVGMILVNVLTVTILGFVGVDFSEYVYYLFWFNLLCVFYMILPGRVGDVFK
jgi:hypothetical protein